jgi:hypothetical protein
MTTPLLIISSATEAQACMVEMVATTTSTLPNSSFACKSNFAVPAVTEVATDPIATITTSKSEDPLIHSHEIGETEFQHLFSLISLNNMLHLFADKMLSD